MSWQPLWASTFEGTKTTFLAWATFFFHSSETWVPSYLWYLARGFFTTWSLLDVALESGERLSGRERESQYESWNKQWHTTLWDSALNWVTESTKLKWHHASRAAGLCSSLYINQLHMTGRTCRDRERGSEWVGERDREREGSNFSKQSTPASPRAEHHMFFRSEIKKKNNTNAGTWRETRSAWKRNLCTLEIQSKANTATWSR